MVGFSHFYTLLLKDIISIFNKLTLAAALLSALLKMQADKSRLHDNCSELFVILIYHDEVEY